MSRNLKDCLAQLKELGLPYDIGIFEGALELGEFVPQTKQWKAVTEAIRCHTYALEAYHWSNLKTCKFSESTPYIRLVTSDGYNVITFGSKGSVVMFYRSNRVWEPKAQTIIKVGPLATIPLPITKLVLFEVSENVFMEYHINTELEASNFGRVTGGSSAHTSRLNPSEGPVEVDIWRIPG